MLILSREEIFPGSDRGSKMTNSQANKKIVTEFIVEVINNRKLDLAGNYFSRDLIWHGWSDFSHLNGLDAFVDLLRQFFVGFPDLHVTMEDVIAEDDKVVLRWNWSGTHQGYFEGIAPTGKRVKVIGLGVFRLEDGKIVERWLIEDFLDLMRQLDALPAKR
jgi:steroid delta-isomerase-like uncharacterized protein